MQFVNLGFKVSVNNKKKLFLFANTKEIDGLG